VFLRPVSGWCWWCRPRTTAKSNRSRIWPARKSASARRVPRPDFFLKYLLKKKGIDPTGASVIGVGLGATAVAAMEQGQIDAAVMLDPSVTVLQGSHPTLAYSSDTRTQKIRLMCSAANIRVARSTLPRRGSSRMRRSGQALTNANREYAAMDSPRILRRRSWRRCRLKTVGKTRSFISRRSRHDPDVFRDRQDGSEGRRCVLAGVQREFAEVAKANIDVSKTWTNKYVDQVKKTTGMNASNMA